MCEQLIKAVAYNLSRAYRAGGVSFAPRELPQLRAFVTETTEESEAVVGRSQAALEGKMASEIERVDTAAQATEKVVA